MQRGAALVTSLLLLLVLTIVGITTMQMSRMQERMTGNTGDSMAAFQAAEAAARKGEAFIAAQTTDPIPVDTCAAAPCGVFTEGLAGGNGRVELQPRSWWLNNGTPSDALPGLEETPQYVLEDMPFMRTDGEKVVGEAPPDGRSFYQVTSRSTGKSGLAEVVIQTTYTRRY
jgi:type IV pilus assembly protein PilX